MNTHYLCTQNALHSPASVQITLAGSLPVTQKSTIPLGSEYRNSTDARPTVRITQYRRCRSKSPARATCPYYRGLRDARRVAVPKTTRAGIAAWRICRYNLDTVPDIHANKAVEAGVQTSCPFQYKYIIFFVHTDQFDYLSFWYSSSFVSFTQFSPTCGHMPLPALSLWPGRQPCRPRLVDGRRGGGPSSAVAYPELVSGGGGF